MEHTIWSNEYDVIESLEKEIMNDPEEFGVRYKDGDDLWATACEINDEYLGDEKANLNIDVGEEIIVIGDLGLWFGRRAGYRRTNKTNIADLLVPEEDYTRFFVDRYGNMRATICHHDGVNYYLYRMWKPGVSEEQKENFLDKVAKGKATSKDITKYTQRIGDRIAEVYGW